ncbi:MAG: ABC transporter substrate-binding protein [Alphaproteobacteria bacterium]|nr:ABC transporter substrate-binding protein [Alphaproteobacteria bacterium]
MPRIARRTAIAAAAATLPRFSVAQTDTRPTITVAVQRLATSNTLDILFEASNVGTRHYNLYVEPLIDTNWTGDLALRPGLAESWRRIDGSTLEFKLRPGVTFHNGDAFTAEDVAWTYGERLFGAGDETVPSGGKPDLRWAPAKVRAGAKAAYPALEKIEIVDSHTIRFVNRVPDVTLEGRVSMRTGCILNPRAFREAPTWMDWARKPVGTGPYQVAEYRAENRLILEAFDGYWGGRPPIKTLRFLEVPELASRINGLKAGEFDFACDITPDQIPTIESSPRHQVVGGLITNIRGLIFDQNHKVLKDARIRRALSHAIDRNMIVETIWGGRSRVPNGLQFDYFGPMYATDWKGIRFDPAESRRLLAEAGYKGEPIPFKVLANYYTNQVATAQILVEMWKAVGVNVDLQMRENWGQVLDGKVERAMNDNSFSAFFNDPVSFFPTTFGRNGELEQGGYWRNAEAATLIDRIQTSTDIAARAADFRRVLEIVERDDPALLVLHETANFTAKRRDIAWSPARSFVMDFRSRNFAIG